MKYVFTILFLFVSILVFAQTPPSRVRGAGSPNIETFNPGFASADSGTVITSFPDTATANRGPNLKWRNGLQIKVGTKSYMRDTLLRKWIELGSGSSGNLGGPITSNRTTPGTNPGTNLTTDQWIDSIFYYAQPPTATLTGGGIFEFTSASTLSATLNWSASRQSATKSIATIVVAGNNETFSQPGAPGTVSGTQSVTVTTNTSTTYNNIVTTIDAQTVTASTTFAYQQKIYAGFITTTTPSDADILAATNSTYVGGKFATTRLQSGYLSTPAGSRYVVFVAPASFGTPTVIINGLTVAYNLTTRIFVNASGYSSSYIIAVSPFPTFGAIDVYSVQ